MESSPLASNVPRVPSGPSSMGQTEIMVKRLAFFARGAFADLFRTGQTFREVWLKPGWSLRGGSTIRGHFGPSRSTLRTNCSVLRVLVLSRWYRPLMMEILDACFGGAIGSVSGTPYPRKCTSSQGPTRCEVFCCGSIAVPGSCSSRCSYIHHVVGYLHFRSKGIPSRSSEGSNRFESLKIFANICSARYPVRFFVSRTRSCYRISGLS